MNERNSPMRRMAITSTVALLLMAFAAPAAVLAQTSAPKVPIAIAGKPYSIKPGATPGTWTVTWGDQTYDWKPVSWMEDPLKQQGPAYYAQWSQPGMPFPFEVPIDQRDKLTPTDM